MARANTLTKLPLDKWASIVGLNPVHFNGVYWPDHPPTVCGQPWLQFSYQTADRVGREDIARAIAQAESDMEKELHFRLRPTWEVDEWRPTERPWRPELHNLSITGLRGFNPTADAKWGYLISGGIRSKELVEADAVIAYSDDDGDGYEETATVTATVAFTDACEIALFFPDDGIVRDAGDDRWQIRPIEASINGVGLATIRFRREQAVLPELQNRVVPPADDSHQRGVDGSDDDNFLTGVDIYRVYNDPQLQVQMLWEPKGCVSCNGAGCTGCSYRVQLGCLMVREDPRNSIVVYRPANWNSDTLSFDNTAWSVGREPDLVRLWYYAGWRDKQLDCPTLEMDSWYQHAVAYYAAALLERSVCGCDNVKAYVDRWQTDLSRSPPDGGFRAISPRNLDNPFGTRAGAIFAWNRLDQAIHGQAVRT